ncbi:PREDICTED: free fatty acid receptor 2-like [Nanorana parkeri]|uniref:free fatty acid receptor 2-like n=1 Tax=Nanorana parkeri TaxID=125878 RepID=UPI0008549C9A|nr:PREDICTED: free fatty acid receptor 2-like [Nanorana parkeri]
MPDSYLLNDTTRARDVPDYPLPGQSYIKSNPATTNMINSTDALDSIASESSPQNDNTWSLVEHTQIVLAIYILTFVTGLPSNLLAFYAFLVKVRKKPTPVDILLLNLTISDLLLLMFLPLKMKEAADGMLWNMPIFLCPLTGFCYYSSIYISTLFLTAVSIERYLGVAHPIKYKLHRKPEYAIFASICFWLLACAHCSVVYIVQYCVDSRVKSFNETKCYDNFTEEQLKILLPVRLELGVTLFFIPSIITLFCYINFIRILTSLPNIQKKRKQRAIGLAIATLANFCICFAPYNISHIVGFVNGKSPKWRVDALLLSTFNATLDPVVFYFTSTAVQKTFFDFLVAILRKLGRLCPFKRFWPSPGEPPYNDSNLDRSST